MSATLIGFSSGGWAFREAERAAVRPALAATLLAAVRDGNDPAAVAARSAFPPVASRLRASLIGRIETTSPIDAALLNGIAAGATATIATPAVCSALAAGESAGAPGAIVLDAIVAGVEVAVRVEHALGGHAERGWDARGSAGRLGAAVAASRAFGLSRDAAQHAFGLAATAAGGLLAARGTTAEAAIVGNAAADGVEAALLARAGFTSAPAALDGRRGLAALMADRLDPALLVAELGERFFIADTPAPLPEMPSALHAAVAGIERAASLAALLAAARA